MHHTIRGSTAFLIVVQLLPCDIQVLLRALINANHYQANPSHIRSDPQSPQLLPIEHLLQWKGWKLTPPTSPKLQTFEVAHGRSRSSKYCYRTRR